MQLYAIEFTSERQFMLVVLQPVYGRCFSHPQRVTHPNTNWARCRITLLMQPATLLLSEMATTTVSGTAVIITIFLPIY